MAIKISSVHFSAFSDIHLFERAYSWSIESFGPLLFESNGDGYERRWRSV